MFNLFCICVLATFAHTRAQVHQQDRYIELQPGQRMNITNIEYPNGYPLGSARQTKIRVPYSCQIRLICQVAVGGISGDCTDYNGIRLQLDGTTYLNSSSAYQICNKDQVYRFTSRYNTAMIGHYSTPDQNGKTGAWYCQAEAVQKSSCDCGWQTQTKIVGGTYSQPNAHPSMVVLLDRNNNLLGAGTIIDSNAILTAAHVISNGNGGVQNLGNILVHIGRSDIRQPFYEDTLYSEIFRIRDYSILPGFDEANDRNDMAILYTDQIMAESRGVGPICLPNANRGRSEYDYEPGTIVGFGAIGFGMEYSYREKEGRVSIRPIESCRPQNAENKICAQSIGNDETDTCQGDSGGPLYYFDRAIGRQRIIGITQSGVYCGAEGFYEFVPARMNWIISQVRSVCLYN